MLAPLLDELRRKLALGDAIVAGVLSGTSADGIDVALVRFAPDHGDLGRPELRAFATRPFRADLGDRVRRVLDGRPCGLRETALLSRDLGRAFGRAARELAEERGLALDLAASHGQTVWHHDGGECGPATLQLGDGDFVAEEAGCAVASDFRQRDVAAGGEGAPLSALADGALFADLPRPAAVLNLGGMANVTVLADAPLAFDTGPAGSLLDGLARRLLDRPYDDGGRTAAGGEVDGRLLGELLRHPFFDRPPPKSTGRDTFGEAYVDSVLSRARKHGCGGAADVLATASELVARTVVEALERRGPGDLRRMVVCGGGARHGRLLDALARLAPWPVTSGADAGVDPDAREALVFAVLGARCALGIPSTHAVTGALPGRVLGKLSAPPPRGVERV